MIHQPIPRQATVAHGPSVDCSCGLRFAVGMLDMPITKNGKTRRYRLRTMKMCWDAYREHWQETRAEPRLTIVRNGAVR